MIINARIENLGSLKDGKKEITFGRVREKPNMYVLMTQEGMFRSFIAADKKVLLEFFEGAAKIIRES